MMSDGPFARTALGGDRLLFGIDDDGEGKEPERLNLDVSGMEDRYGLRCFRKLLYSHQCYMKSVCKIFGSLPSIWSGSSVHQHLCICVFCGSLPWIRSRYSVHHAVCILSACNGLWFSRR